MPSMAGSTLAAMSLGLLLATVALASAQDRAYATLGGHGGAKPQQSTRRGLRRTKGHGAAEALLAPSHSPGPCVGTTVLIGASSASDIEQRSLVPPTTPVLIILNNSIELQQGLVLGPRYACTRFSSPNSAGVTLRYSKDDMPAVTIYGTNNIWFDRVSISHGANPNSPPCASGLFDEGKDSPWLVCPGVYIVNSFGIQLNNADVFGRIDVFRSLHVLLDHLNVRRDDGTYYSPSAPSDLRPRGLIRMGQTSAGSSAALSHHFISNCDIAGGWELITLYRGASGVTISNNYLHNFTFTAIRCGGGGSFAMDCFSNFITRNFIWNPASYLTETSAIWNSGIYFNTGWFNPANYLSCNYILNQRYCYAFDHASSGINVNGGVCHNSWTAVRISNGKFNKVKNLVVSSAIRFFSIVTCITLYDINCFFGEGNNWEALRRAYYDSPYINQRYPKLKAICNPVLSSINNVICNPPSQVDATVAETGYCSGLPYGNGVEVFAYSPPAPQQNEAYAPQRYPGCANLTTDLTLMNNQSWVNVTSSGNFLNPDALTDWTMDFGLPSESPIYKIKPGFKSCPRSAVGPQDSGLGYNQWFFNIPQPDIMKEVISFDTAEIKDPTLHVPPSNFTVDFGFVNGALRHMT